MMANGGWRFVVFDTIDPPGSHPLGLQLGVCGTSDENGVFKLFESKPSFKFSIIPLDLGNCRPAFWPASS